MSYEFQCTTPIGWECPKCGRVYSPTTTMCQYCGGQSTTVSNGIDNLLKHYDVVRKTMVTGSVDYKDSLKGLDNDE